MNSQLSSKFLFSHSPVNSKEIQVLLQYHDNNNDAINCSYYALSITCQDLGQVRYIDSNAQIICKL